MKNKIRISGFLTITSKKVNNGSLIILIYFIIGFGGSLFIYDYHCKDFIKINRNRQYKLTWEEYSRKAGIEAWVTFSIVLWPILAIICICYFIFQYPLECIKERNGIK